MHQYLLGKEVRKYVYLFQPPSAVTAVIKNSWITKSVRQGMLSSAVWGIISAKARKCQPGGFLSELVFHAV